MCAIFEAATARRYTWRPLTPDHWNDLAALFGPNGASSGCWCMSFRLDGARFRAQCADGGAANREALRVLTNAGNVPGILAYESDIPVGWCAVGPRDTFPKLDRSSIYWRRDDAPGDTPVWSIVCFYIGRAHRRRGVMAYLVRAAVEYVREHGGGIVEAYPRREPGAHAASTAWAGLLPVFTAAGFAEVSDAPKVASVWEGERSGRREAHASPVRSIVRYTVAPAPTAS
jgi:GNAT superfamily N-acetyltransferase